MEKRSNRTERNVEHKPLLVSVEKAAEMLGIGRVLCYQLIACGELVSVKIKGRRLVPVAAIHAYIRRLMDESAA